MDVLHLFTRDPAAPMRHEAAWVATSLVLGAVVGLGYVAMAFRWFFQSRLARQESAAALRHQRNVLLVSAACGAAFWSVDMPWFAWRAYDGVLACLAYYTWSFVFRTRGFGLVDELERVARRYGEIAELLPHVVWTATSDGKVDYGNQRWSEYSDAPAWTDALHPDESDDVLAWWADAVRRRAPVGRELRLRARDGSYRAFSLKATPVFHGAAVKWLGACADIEEQRLLAVAKEVQARQKAFFLNALSHDLRAPLNNVVLNAHVLKLAPGEPVDLESVNVIIENATAAGELLSRLLEFARAGEEQNATAETVCIAAMLQQIGRRFAAPARAKGLSLTVAEGNEGLTCRVDRQKLERIVSNLVDNAIKHTRAGGVSLSAEPASASAPDPISIRVTDTGEGIPDADVPYLFDEFYQVNNHERDRSKGFGLGLAICRSLARQIGGDVRLLSTGRDGTCFEVWVVSARGDDDDGAGGRGRLPREEGGRADPAAQGLCRA